MPSEVKRVALYLRVSTEAQSYELQSRELLNYCQARGWSEPDIYEDIGSGTKAASREMFQKLIQTCKERKYDVVVVWKLDRFARSLKDLVNTLQELSDVGVEFISLKDQIDMTTSSGRLMTHIIGAFAQFEADLIRSRVNAGIANARAKGVKLGRPSRINSFDVQKLRREGLSLSRIAKRLQVTKSAVSKILSRDGDPKALNNMDIAQLLKVVREGEKTKVLETA